MSASIVWNEARQAWRGLLRRPGYLMLAVVTLALGVATSTAVFSLIDQALLKPLPFPESERLVTIGRPYDARVNQAAPAYLAPARNMRSLVSVGMARTWAIPANIARGEQSGVISSISADRGFLETLRLPMAVGRNFSEDEVRPNGPQAIILGHAFWQRFFDGDPAIVGQTLQLEGRGVQVVGVLPAAFQWPSGFDIIQPLQLDPNTTELSYNELLIGRLRSGVGLDEASAEAASVIGRVELADAGASDGRRQALEQHPPNALPLKSSVFMSRSGTSLWLFFGAAICVLAIAVINLTSLMVLRALGRRHDAAVRLALGANARRLALPALSEGLLIGALGSVIGLLMAWLGLRTLGGLVPGDWMRGGTAGLEPTGLVFALSAGVLTAVIAAMTGMMRMRRIRLAAELVGGGRSGWSRASGRFGRALVVAQVAIAVVLLVSAALFTRSLQKLEAVPMGFETASVTLFELMPVKARHLQIEQAVAQTRRIVERIRAMPGVTAVGASTNPPTASQLNFGVTLADGRVATVQYRLQTPGFLEVFGIPLLAGRAFDDDDVAGGERVCLVSRVFAERYFDGQALGQVVIVTEADGQVPMRVVGVVGDVRQHGPGEPAPPIVYTPLTQMSQDTWELLRTFGALTYAVRTQAGSLVADEAALREAVGDVAPQQPISGLQTMDALVASTTSQQKLALLLVGLFAALALLLACVGLYAVMATSVAARRHEFGVRAALGAPPARLLRQVLFESGRQIALGLAIGLTVALAGSRVLQGFLFGVEAADPLAITLVLLVLALTGALASLVPALRAARVPPMQALRT
ncbi:ADOP family duplicated permease [Luteimonas sp. XNQY3]|nr:ADOP family duplicated permease [Luteimonas sp. XNQY3]